MLVPYKCKRLTLWHELLLLCSLRDLRTLKHHLCPINGAPMQSTHTTYWPLVIRKYLTFHIVRYPTIALILSTLNNNIAIYIMYMYTNIVLGVYCWGLLDRQRRLNCFLNSQVTLSCQYLPQNFFNLSTIGRQQLINTLYIIISNNY